MRRILIRVYYCAVILSLWCAPCHGQQNDLTEVGLVNYGSYHGGDVDQVDLKSGNLFARIPLFSLPQLGRLSLSMSMVLNNNGFAVDLVCQTFEIFPTNSNGDDSDSYPETLCSPYVYRSLPIGPSLVLDQDVEVTSAAVSDASGASHLMGYDLSYSSASVEHALDGSGYTYVTSPSPFDPTAPSWLYTSSGIQYNFTPSYSSVNGVYGLFQNKSISDPTIVNGAASGANTIRYMIGYPQLTPSNYGQGCTFNTSVQYPGDPGQSGIYLFGPDQPTCLNPGQITDSLGRTIPAIAASPILSDSASLANCPVFGPSDQVPTGAQLWTVPGPTATSGTGSVTSTSTYIFCYTNITYSTNFMGGWWYVTSPPDSQVESTVSYYADAMGTGQVIQSIVLPNKTYWGFVYDSVGAAPYISGSSGALNPCSGIPSTEWCSTPSPVAYGDVLKIIRPSGGNTSYQYEAANGAQYEACNLLSYLSSNGPGGQYPPLRLVQSRTVSDGMGNSSTWGYSWQGGYNASQTVYETTTVTNPPVGSVHSSTQHTFNGLSSPSGFPTSCSLPETLTQTFEGSNVISSTSTQYTANISGTNVYALSPVPAQYLPHIVQMSIGTANGLALTGTTTYGYAPLFTQGYPENTDSSLVITSAATKTVLFSSPTSVLTQGADGVTSESLTTYEWQLFPETAPGGFSSPTVNMLSAPASTCVLSYAASNPSYGCGSSLGSASASASYQYGDSSSPYNLSSLQQWLNGSWITTQSMQHDQYGRVSSVSDAVNTTHIFYGTDPVAGAPSPFPNQITNALNQSEYYLYDDNSGNLLWSTDANGSGPNDPAHTTNYTYDNVGRLTDVKTPPTHYGRGEVTRCYVDFGQSTSCPGGSTPNTVYSTLVATPDPNLTASQTYDGLGRPIKSFGTNGAESDTAYDALGRVYSINNPHFTSGSSTDGYAYFAYDALGRKTSVVLQPSGNTLQWCYNGWATEGQTNCNAHSGSFGSGWVDSANEAGVNWQQSFDSLGRLTKVLEPGPTTQLETDYTYDVLGNLLTATQNGTNGEAAHFRSFTYDSWSRVICASNPESSQNPCPSSAANGLPSNVVTYLYDANSNLTAKTDARGTKTLYNYDALNRLLGKCFTTGSSTSCTQPDQSSTPSSCYQYDTATNGIGALGASWTQAGPCPGTLPAANTFTSKKILEYDAMGGLRKEQLCTPGNCTTTASNPYALSYEYDLAGNIKLTGDGLGQASWFRQYDSAGRLSGITANTIWPTSLYPNQLYSAGSFTPTGVLSSWTIGSSSSGAALTGSRQYDSLQRPTWESVTGHE